MNQMKELFRWYFSKMLYLYGVSFCLIAQRFIYLACWFMQSTMAF